MHEPWSDREIARFTFRHALFQRRGMPEPQAEALAERLVLRDRDRDDRRCCAECSNLQDDGGCFQARRMNTARRRAADTGEDPPVRHALDPIDPMPAVLQRCRTFSFSTP